MKQSEFTSEEKMDLYRFAYIFRIEAINKKYSGGHEAFVNNWSGLYNNDLHVIYIMGSGSQEIEEDAEKNNLIYKIDYVFLTTTPEPAVSEGLKLQDVFDNSRTVVWLDHWMEENNKEYVRYNHKTFFGAGIVIANLGKHQEDNEYWTMIADALKKTFSDSRKIVYFEQVSQKDVLVASLSKFQTPVFLVANFSPNNMLNAKGPLHKNEDNYIVADSYNEISDFYNSLLKTNNNLILILITGASSKNEQLLALLNGSYKDRVVARTYDKFNKEEGDSLENITTFIKNTIRSFLDEIK